MILCFTTAFRSSDINKAPLISFKMYTYTKNNEHNKYNYVYNKFLIYCKCNRYKPLQQSGEI